jgi:hypothetical protein
VKKIVIVASGTSLIDFDFKTINDDIDILSINSSIYKLHRSTFWFTLDPSESNRKIMREKPIKDCKYFAAVDPEFGTQNARTLSERLGRESGINWLLRKRGDKSGSLQAKFGLSEIQGEINTGNSCYGALGLAYLFGYNRIVILGLDAIQGGRFCDSGRTNDLSHLLGLFRSSINQLVNNKIIVINGSEHSAVDCFERVTPKKAVKWLNTI